jgi:hypothetical protein
LEKVRATKRLDWCLPGAVDQRFSVKFEIRFIDEHSRLRRRLRNLQQNIARDRGAGRIVRVRHRDEPRARADLRQQFLRGKGKIVAAAHLDHARAFGQSKNRIHGEGGHNDQRFVSRDQDTWNRADESLRRRRW